MPGNESNERIKWSFRISLNLLEQLHSYASDNRLAEDEVIARALDMYFAVEHDMAIVNASFDEDEGDLDDAYFEFRDEYRLRRRRGYDLGDDLLGLSSDTGFFTGQEPSTNDWARLSEQSFKRLWDNDTDSIYDDWRRIYGVDSSDDVERGG